MNNNLLVHRPIALCARKLTLERAFWHGFCSFNIAKQFVAKFSNALDFCREFLFLFENLL